MNESTIMPDHGSAGEFVVTVNLEMGRVLDLVRHAADTDYPILLQGDTGVGKGMVARYIHRNSPRSNQPFVSVNCGAIPATLFEAEVFGFERGAFTNAFTRHRGFFEQADLGTIFLDEISELPLENQVKLLRTLEDNRISPLGREGQLALNVRIVSAANQDLRTLVERGKFRKDLYYRLSTFDFHIPPLHERKEDIVELTKYFLTKHGGNGRWFTNDALSQLCNYKWPGNVRELEWFIVRLLHQGNGQHFFSLSDFPTSIIFENKQDEEKEDLICALNDASGCISIAARKLGIHRNTVYNKLRTFAINPSDFRQEQVDQPKHSRRSGSI